MNIRVQISLDEETRKVAERRASELGISLGEYFARLVNRDCGDRPKKKVPKKRKADISSIFGLGRSAEPTNIAHEKDKLIGEAVWKDYLRKTGRK